MPERVEDSREFTIRLHVPGKLFARIIDFKAPESATPGTEFTVEVDVKNEELLGAQVLLQIWDEQENPVFHEERWIDAGATETFTATLTMPDRDYTLTAHTWYLAERWIYQDSASRTIKREVPPPPPAKGILECHAYADAEEVAATVEVVGVATYTTPFTVELDPRTYTLRAAYAGQTQEKTATIEAGKKTRVDFTFAKPPVPPPILPIAIPVIAGGVVVAAAAH